ncbi:hypothetical protein D3C75_259630 [compost metagenome]
MLLPRVIGQMNYCGDSARQLAQHSAVIFLPIHPYGETSIPVILRFIAEAYIIDRIALSVEHALQFPSKLRIPLPHQHRAGRKAVVFRKRFRSPFPFIEPLPCIYSRV